MARQVRPVRARAVPQRRKRIWARNSTVNTPAAAVGGEDILSDYQTAAGIAAAPPGVTVGGVLLDLSVVQTSARSSSTDGFMLGILVSTETTVSELPSPVGDPHADWMWYQYFAAPGAASGAQYSTASVQAGPIRIRARRRMDELGMHLYIVTALRGLTTYDLRLETSTLLILP